MKLTKKELERIHTVLCLYWGIPDTASKNKILNKIEDMISEIIKPGSTKPTKCFPIETAPIDQKILLWSDVTKDWEKCFFNSQESLRLFLLHNTHCTHWRPMPKVPK